MFSFATRSCNQRHLKFNFVSRTLYFYLPIEQIWWLQILLEWSQIHIFVISCRLIVKVYKLSFKFGDHRTYASGGITFFLSGFSFTNIHNLQDSGVKNRLSLKLLLTTSTRFTDTQALAGDYYRELTSTHNKQPDSNWEALVSQCKLVTTKLRALKLVCSLYVSKAM